jgi:hypothetical protein
VGYYIYIYIYVCVCGVGVEVVVWRPCVLKEVILQEAVGDDRWEGTDENQGNGTQKPQFPYI